jgi:hypothetical protein
MKKLFVFFKFFLAGSLECIKENLNTEGNILYCLLQSRVAADPCYERKCTTNEHCCDGSVCVDMEGKQSALYLKKLFRPF